MKKSLLFIVALFLKYEPFPFCLVVAANLFPVLLHPNVLALDGPAHVYNAALIKEWVTGDGFPGHIFEFNPVPVPNWTGHLILTFFQFFFSAVFSEKLFVLTLLVLMPFSFRYLVRSFPGTPVIGSYFIFAITYNYFQFLGFYNFLLAFVPACYLLGYLVRHVSHLKTRHYVVMGLLLVVIYFSHAFLYLFCLLAIALTVVFHSVIQAGIRPRALFPFLFKTSWPFVLLVLPSAVLFTRFSLTSPVLEPVYLPAKQLFQWWIENRSLVAYTDAEVAYTMPIMIVTILLCLLALGFTIVRWKKEKKTGMADTVPVLLLLLFIMLFVLPDGDGWGCYYAVRTLLLIHLFMFLWAAITPFWSAFKLMALIILLYNHGQLLRIHHNETGKQQVWLASCTQAGHYVQRNKLVLPVNVTGNWVFMHAASRVGVVNGAVMLENYEADLNYFPLWWKKRGLPHFSFPSGEVPRELVTWPEPPASDTLLIDYIFVMGDLNRQTSAGYTQLRQVIRTDYKMIFSENNCHLYQRTP